MKLRFFLIGAICGMGAGLVVVLASAGKLLPAGAAEGPPVYQAPGDVNGDGNADIGDAVYLLNYLFAEGPEPAACPPSGGGALLATGQTKCYDADGDEIPCDSADYPGQDGFYQAGCPMEARFIDNGDGTVTDTCTGLMWQQATADTDGDGRITRADPLTWQQALKYCEDLEFAGYTDWRLPNIRELLSIVDYGHFAPAIARSFRGGAMSMLYWSSSTDLVFLDSAWYVYFYHGSVCFASLKTDPGYVRAVRSAP